MKIYHGDCASVMPSISGVDCIITGPPYWEPVVAEDASWSEQVRYVNMVSERLILARKSAKKDAWLWYQANDALWRGRATALTTSQVLRRIAPTWTLRHEIVLARAFWPRESEGVSYTHDHLYLLSAGEPEFLASDVSSVWMIKHDSTPADAPYMAFDPEMVSRCIDLTCKPGSLIMDPFCGSGMVGLVAERMGMGFIGIEKNPYYISMMKETNTAVM